MIYDLNSNEESKPAPLPNIVLRIEYTSHNIPFRLPVGGSAVSIVATINHSIAMSSGSGQPNRRITRICNTFLSFFFATKLVNGLSYVCSKKTRHWFISIFVLGKR